MLEELAKPHRIFTTDEVRQLCSPLQNLQQLAIALPESHNGTAYGDFEDDVYEQYVVSMLILIFGTCNAD